MHAVTEALTSRPDRRARLASALVIITALTCAFTADIHTDSFHGCGGLPGLTGFATWTPPAFALTAALLAWLLRARRVASRDGFSWCSTFGRARHVSWTSVVAVRTRRDSALGDHH